MATYEDLSVTNLRTEEIDGAKTPYKIEFTVGAEATNVVNVAVQLQTESEASVEQILALEVWLSSVSTGLGLITTGPDGAVAIGTDGVIIDTYTAKKHYLITTDADGKFDLDLTEAGALTGYLVIKNPLTGKIHVSSVMTWTA